jgi:peptidyl-prolyl cis-trans isomerase C
MTIRALLRSLLLYFVIFQQCHWSFGFVGGALNKVIKDFQALTRRVTARHILVSNEEIALAMKRKIRDQCIDKNAFVIDVFEEAARKYSKDDTTNTNGGLLGVLVAQGYCKSQILDRACFQVPLGLLEGPIESEFGFHLLLVTERTNCPMLDGKNTKLIMQESNDIFGTLRPSDQIGEINILDFVKSQIGFWLLVFVAGGLVAELAGKVASIVIQ